MRAHLLLRVSTDKQAKAGTIKAQRGPVRELAERLGADELIEYVEEGVSGAAKLADRDVMRALLDEVKPGELVCAFDQSRLTRADSMRERYAILGEIADKGARCAFVADGEIDTETIGGRITMHVRGEIAADERKKFKARTMAGKKAAALQGRKVAGSTPYGWHFSKDTRTWSLAEPAASVRRELLARIVAGESCNRIAESFNGRGITYPARKKKNGGTSQPDWTARRVWHFAAAPVNKGVVEWNGTTIAVPPLVDADAFARVQLALSRGQQNAGRAREQHVHLLAQDHGRCFLCEAPVRVQYGNCHPGEAYAYYVCRNALGKRRTCTLPWWRVDEADAIVWRQVKRMLDRPDLVEEALRERADESGADSSAAAGDVDKGEARLQFLGQHREFLLGQCAKGNLPQPVLDKELAKIAREETLIGQTVAAARAEVERARAIVTEIGSVKAWLAAVRQELRGADAHERRRIVRVLAPTVQLDIGKIRVGLRLRGALQDSGQGAHRILGTIR